MTEFTHQNDVKTITIGALTPADVSIVAALADAPFNNFPDPATDTVGVATIVDDLSNPTQIEIVYYDGVTITGTDQTLTGVSRGQEGTTAQSFADGAFIFMAATSELLRSPALNSIEQKHLAASLVDLINAPITPSSLESDGSPGPSLIPVRSESADSFDWDEVRPSLIKADNQVQGGLVPYRSFGGDSFIWGRPEGLGLNPLDLQEVGVGEIPPLSLVPPSAYGTILDTIKRTSIILTAGSLGGSAFTAGDRFPITVPIKQRLTGSWKLFCDPSGSIEIEVQKSLIGVPAAGPSSVDEISGSPFSITSGTSVNGNGLDDILFMRGEIVVAEIISVTNVAWFSLVLESDIE